MAMVPKTSLRSTLRERVAALPNQPGVYFFKDARGTILYVGKALSLRRRVASYFRLPTAHAPRVDPEAAPMAPRLSTLSPRIANLMGKVADLEIRLTTSEAEALLLEAQLIKEHQPSYNVAFRDDKTYPLLKITHEPFPRLIVTRRKLNDGATYFGPYTDAGLMHEAVRFMRRVFPLRTCKRFPPTPCLEYHLGQCLAPCAAYLSARSYQRIVDDLIAFLQGRRDQLLREISRRMDTASRDRRYEEATRLRNQLQALTSVIVAKEQSLAAGPLEQLQAALKLPRLPRRIEAFDISNIFGEWAVGSLVVFTDGKPHKAHYRRFKIKTVQGIDDYQMMREVIRRRYSGSLARELPLPDLILVDGGRGQLAAAGEALTALALRVPTIGLAKRFEQLFTPQSPQPIVLLRTSPVLHLIQHLRDEAHRFAITYHRQLRSSTITSSRLDRIRGVGPSRKHVLLRHFGSIAALAAASPGDVARAGRLPLVLAETILQHLRQTNT